MSSSYYANRVFEPGLSAYADRVTQFGVADSSVVLDVGCGPGQWCLAAASRARLALGIDRSTDFVESAGRRSRTGGHRGCGFAQGDVHHLPVRTGAADLVLCIGVLPYVDEGQVVAEIARVLRGGGRLYLVTLGPGYYLRWALTGLLRFRLRESAYGLRTIMNTVVYRLLGVAPRGDRCHSPRYIRSVLAKHRFSVLEQRTERPYYGPQHQTYLGFSYYYSMLSESQSP